MDENRKKLYDQLSANYDMGTFDEFDSDLDNEDNQKVAWEAMGGQDGYGDFGLFQQAIARSPQAAEAGTTGSTESTETTENIETPAEATAAAEPLQPAWPAQDGTMPIEEDADISLPDAGKPTTPKDQPTEDEEIVNEPAGAAVVPAGDEQQLRVDAVDYSTLSDDELMRNMGVMPGHELTQRDIESRMTFIESLRDPVAQQTELFKLNQSIAEWNRRTERAHEAQRESAKVAQTENVNAVAQLSDNNQYLANEVNATLKKDTTVDSSGTSEFSRAMMNDGLFKQFNDIIREIRSNIASWPDERLRQELINRSFDNTADSMERAVYNVAIAKELEARSRGGHATTVGEDNFAEYIESLRAQDPERARAIEAHADGYDTATRGHASSVQDHGDAALDDNPSYAVPRIAFELLKLRRAELSRRMDALKQGAPGGTTTAAIEAMGYGEMLTSEDYEACFRQAEELFGRDKIEGYNAQIMRRHDETMGEAVARYEREVMSTFMDIVSDDMRPKNNWEYVFGYIAHNNFGSRVLQGLHGALHSAPPGLDFSTVYNSSVAQYTTAHSDGAVNVAAQVFAPTATFMLGAGCIGEFIAPNIVGRWTSNFALRAVGGGTAAGMRSMAQKGIVKYGTSMLSTGTNFAALGLQNELIHQLSTGDVEGVRLLVATLEEGLKGAAFGGATALMGKVFERATGWKAYVGEAAKIGVEASAFTGMGYLEARMNGKDGLTLADVGTNIGIVAGSKMSHFKQWSSEVRQRARNEGIYGRKVNYHEISKREREQLESLGYHGVAIALKGSLLSEDQARAIDAELSQMRNDKNVPWELVRCADWVLNGRMSVPPAVADARVDGDAVNGYVITAVDSTGRAIRGGVTVKGNDAKNDMVRLIKKEADVARYAAREQKMVEAQSARDQAMCAQQFCAMSDGKYTDVGVVLKIFGEALRKVDAKEKLGDVEEEVLTGVGVLLAKMDMSDIVGDRRKQTEQAYKVDLDKAIKKDASERTDAEKAAVDDYNAWLDRNQNLLSFESENFKNWVAGAEPAPTRSEHFTPSEDLTKVVHDRLDAWGNRIDTGDIVVVNSFDELTNEEVRNKIIESEAEGKKDYPGFYINGKAYIYVPHIRDGKDVDATIMHELVSHKGLRGLMNRPGQFEAFCDEVWASMRPEDRNELWNYPSGDNIKTEQDRQRMVADEYIARLSERTDADGLHLWNKFVALLYKYTGFNFKSIGLDAQLREDIRESYRNLREQRGERVEPGEETEVRQDNDVVLNPEGEAPREEIAEPTADEVAAPTETVETPAESEPPVERPTAAVGRVEGTPADMNDWAELLAENDAASLPAEEVQAGLELMEREREQAHRYAAGELAEEPSNWEYWAARDGLIEPTRQAEPVSTELPVDETPKEPVVETESQHTEPVATEASTETAQRATKLPKGANAEAETMEPSELPVTRHIATMVDAWGPVTRAEIVGQNDNGTTRVRLWFKNRDQRGVETDVDLRGPQPPEPPAPPTEPTGDAATADTTTERPTEVTGSADDQRMNDVLSEKLTDADAEAERRAAQEADPYYMPMENKGGGRMSPNWRKATAEQIFNHLNDRENASGRDTLDGNIADGVKRAEDKVKDVERCEPKGKGRSDKSLTKWEKELTEARAQLEKWREVERMRQEQKSAEGEDSDLTFKQAYDEYTRSDEEPTNLEDYVARHLYGTKFKWKDKEFERTGGRTHGLGGHLGLSKSDKERRGFFGWIDEKNGSYPESVAEGLYANMPDWMRERYDTMEVLDAVLSVVGGSPRPRDMVVDYAKRLREQARADDELQADQMAGERGFADAGEMDAYDNMREREATGFHDVAAAGREADGARADLLADAQARLNDPNASEYEKLAARAVLRFRQRGGQSTLQGLDGYTEDEVLSMVREDIEEKLADAGVDGVRINGMAIHGSRKRGDARSDSDLDVVVEYDGDISEDGLFNLLNDVPLTIEGVAIDINPITEGKSGTLAQYMERSRRYDASKTADRDIRFRVRDDERRPTFYSNAERTVENVKQGKATAEQWKAMLTKAGGIKAGEDKWMGLTDWLDEHKGQPLTKDEVLQFVRDNGVRMEEFGYTEHPKGFDDLKREYDQWLRTEGFDYAQEQLRERFGDDTDIAFDDLGGELVISNEEAAAALLGSEQPINSTRLDYTTEGLENKREIAFVVPGVEPYQKNDAVHFGPENEGRAVMWVRFGETTDKDGNRVLVIDEIQSNRHQDAREIGYKGHGPEYERLKQQAQNTQDAYFEQIEEYARTADGRLDRTKLNRAKEDDPLSKALWEQWSNDERALRQYNESHGFSESSAIPAAPFEKNWHEVAMKRMLRLAAEEGFDKVAWTTGAQQAERYGIGGVVESITKGKTRGENTLVSVQYKNGKHDSWVVAPDGKVVDGGITTGENLSDLIGKELSEKVMSLDENGSISGDGLRIGGEGMSGFYDQIVPSFMRKYVKKWGSQVGDVELATPGGEVMHSVDVTEPMRDSVMQGQPLFRVRDDEYADAVAAGKSDAVRKMVLDAVKEAMPDTKAVDRWGKPRLLFHGTPSEDKFYVFRDGMIFLTSSESNANQYTHYRRALSTNPFQTGRVMPCFVDMRNPLVVEGNRHLWNNIDVDWSSTPVDTEAIGDYAKEHGYDGVIIKKVRDNMRSDDPSYADVYIAFDSSQVKSAGPTYEQSKRDHFPWDDYEHLSEKIGATYDDNGNLIPLSERFDRSNSDVRFRVRGGVSGEPADHTTAVEDARRRLESADASEFERQAARAVIKAYGGGSDDTPDGGGPRFRMREPQKAIEDYERAVNSSGFQVTEALQDSMMGLKKLMQAIVGKDAKGKEKAIQDIAGFENAYLKENRLQSESVAQVDEYRTGYYTPLVKAVSALIGKGGKKHRTEAMAELTDYMMAKHGLERNIVLAERDATEEFESDANKDGNGNYIRNYDDILAEKREKDYSGLTALTGEADVAAAEDAARQMVDAYEAGHDTAELWQRTKAATDATLDKLHDSGVLSDESYSRAKTMFEYYIPLRGWDETTSDEVYGYLTGPDGPLNGNVFKHAEGRRSKADDPLATIMMMASDAIRQGNRNVMKQRFLTFVLNNPSDAVSVNRLWLARNAVTDEWQPVFADLDPTDSPEVVRQKVEQFEQDMAQLAQQDPDNFKHGKQAANIPYKVVNGNIGEHRVLVKHNGQTYVMTINGNPRAAQALNGLTNPDTRANNFVGKTLGAFAKLNRVLSQMFTTYSPKFVVRNFARDMGYSIASSAFVKEGGEYGRKFVANYATVGFMGKLFTKWEDGTLDRSKPLEDMFYQFMHNGGETGFSAPQGLNDYKKALGKELRKENSKTRQLLGSFGEFYLRANRAVENRARFSAFLTSMEMGRGIDRSIWDAKEVSVNFNKKGAGAKMFDNPDQTLAGKTAGLIGDGGRSLFVFWNAAVQGLTNYGKTFKESPVKATTHAALLAGVGYMMPQLMQAIFGDDDDYYDLPEYVRRNNICFRWSKDMPWVTIPLSMEHTVPYAIGDILAGLANGKKQYMNGEEIANDFAKEVSKALPLDFTEGGGGHWWIPSAIKPVYEAYEMNESWTGAPIANQTEWNEQAPEYQRVYKTASKPLVAASELLNNATNSDEDSKGLINLNPSKLEYVFKGYGGGLATLLNDCVRMFDVAFTDAEMEAHDIPIAGSLLKSGNPTTKRKEMMRQYYHYRDDAEGAKWELKNREGDALERFKQTDRYERYLVWKEMSKDVDKLKKQMKNNPDLEAEYYTAVEKLVSAMREQHAGKRKPSQEAIAEVKESERKDSIEALTDKQVHDALVPLSDNAPQDSVDVKREGIKRAYKSEDMRYSKPETEQAAAYERAMLPEDMAADISLKKRKQAVEPHAKQLRKLGANRRGTSWEWDAGNNDAEAYYRAHKRALDAYARIDKWDKDLGDYKKHLSEKDADVGAHMRRIREVRNGVLSDTAWLK